jgi:L-asparaginase
MTADLPTVAVFTLGGTIAMTRDASGGIAPSLSPEALIASVPGLAAVARIEAVPVFQMPGASLTLGDLVVVAGRVEAALAAGAAGAVIVQGTDTIEETAFVLDCLLGIDRPVVVTGAMRGPEAAGADGPANLLAAVTVAAGGARGTGVAVVLGDTVHAARYVRKGHTGLPDAFTSAPFGPLGHVIEGSFRQVATPPPALRLTLREGAAIPPVALLTIGLGEDGRLLPALAGMGFAGAVIAAMGAGHVPRGLAGPLEALALQMPVVLSTRVAGGPVFTRTYGFPGSEIDLLGRGLIHGGSLGALKARLLLQMALASGTDTSAGIADLFVRFG